MFANSVQVRHVIRSAAALLFAMPASAQTDNTVVDDSSRGHRSRPTYSLEIQPIGFGEGITTGNHISSFEFSSGYSVLKASGFFTVDEQKGAVILQAEILADLIQERLQSINHQRLSRHLIHPLNQALESS